VTGSEDVGYDVSGSPRIADVPPVAGMGKNTRRLGKAIGKPDSVVVRKMRRNRHATMTEDADSWRGWHPRSEDSPACGCRGGGSCGHPA
jgi:hypothetical protein